MSDGKLEDFKAYRMALELFDKVVDDMYKHVQSRQDEINRILTATIKTLKVRTK